MRNLEIREKYLGEDLENNGNDEHYLKYLKTEYERMQLLKSTINFEKFAGLEKEFGRTMLKVESYTNDSGKLAYEIRNDGNIFASTEFLTNQPDYGIYIQRNLQLIGDTLKLDDCYKQYDPDKMNEQPEILFHLSYSFDGKSVTDFHAERLAEKAAGSISR